MASGPRVLLSLLAICTLAGAFSLTEPVTVKPRVDYSLGLVFVERWRGTHFLGTEQVIPLDEYLDYQLRESIVRDWKKTVEQTRKQQELSLDASGLIPDIELPKLPLFGEGSKIDISGQDRVTLGGRQTVVEGATRTIGGQSLLPELKMEQQLAVRLNGTVGERTTVSIDHDSERQEGQNKIKLTYQGTEDDVVQAVELGDTRLSIPGTAYTGDLPAHSGLFGASARGKLAGADVYAVASREESQSQSQSFTGKRTVSTDTIIAREYVRQRFYKVVAPGDLVNLRVYVDDQSPANNQSAVKAIATVFPDRPDSMPAGWDWDRDGGDFDLQSLGTDYALHANNVIEFLSGLGPQDVVGLVIFTATDTIGGSYYGDSLVLSLLKPERVDSLSLTWEYELRNVYSLPQSGVDLSSIRLYRDDPQQGEDTEYEDDLGYSGRKFIEFLGLDPNGDGRLEYPEFDSKTGLIRFPDTILHPFASDRLSVRDSVLYRKNQLETDEGRKYYLVAEYSSKTESYYLGQPDILENSERVRVSGELWTKDTDYSINYATGTLTFLRTLPADADISVTFEYRPWFSLAQKSLVGTRAEWKFGTAGKAGSSVFYRSEGVPDDKPALASEPFRRMIAEGDASYDASSDDVSAFVDRLPLVRAQAPSRLSAAVEGAVSLPDPNTRGVAYLDDFESTVITRDASMNALLWYHGSVPVDKDTAQFAATPLFWQTPEDPIRKDSVYGPNIGDEASETQDFLRVVFTPDAGDLQSWAAMANCPSQAGMNLKDLENLQLVMRSRRGRGKLHVTVGMSIDKDAPRRSRSGAILGLNGRLDSEDRNGNGVLDELGEDTGLDTLYGVDSLWTADSADQGNDDYDPETNPAGTEGNRRLDSEDLDRSGFSTYNHYYECEVDLSGSRYATPLYHDWRLYRIPLHDSTLFERIGSPKWEDIRIVRLWFDGFDATDTVDFYSVEFVGSKWRNPKLLIPGSAEARSFGDSTSVRVPQERFVPDERVWVAQISNETDTGYVEPFEPKKDAYGRIETEASLLFGYNDLVPGHGGLVEKTSSEKDDYREYSDLRLYVHDDGNGLDFLFRFGADSANHYEFRAPVDSGRLVAGRDGKWYEFALPLDSFPLLKLLRDSLAPGADSLRSGPYVVRGTPSLADVRYTALGIANSTGRTDSGGVWFGDVRLTAPRRDPGYGFQARASASLSDLATVNLSFGYSDPNFRRFSEGRGVKTGGFGTTLAADLRTNLDRLLPYSWGLSIPLAYSIARQQDVPKYSPQYPDLRLPEGSDAEVAVSRSEDISLSNVQKQRSGNKLMNYTIEAFNLSWRQRRALSRAALARDSSWSMGYQVGYAISPDLSIDLGEDNELSFLPQNIRLGVADARQYQQRASRQSVSDTFLVTTTRGRGLTANLEADYSPIEDFNLDYSLDSERDMLSGNPDTFWFLKLGSEAAHSEDFTASFSPELGDIGDFLSPSVDFDGTYSDERSKTDTVYADFRNMDNAGDIDASLALDLPELLDRLAEKIPAPKPPVPAKGQPDSTGAPEPAPAPKPSPVKRVLSALSGSIDPIDFDYSVSRSSELIKVYDRAPWLYRLGFIDGFTFDSTRETPSVNRELDNSVRVSSGVRVKQFNAGIAYDWSQGRNTNRFATAVDRSVGWPDVDLSLGGVHNLFKQLATDSKISGAYRRRLDVSGELADDTLGMYGRTVSLAHEFSPLLSWQTTWKKRVSSTVGINYSKSAATNFQSQAGDNRSVTDSDSRGADLSMSYYFSAPSGLKLPILKKIKFSSDLRLTWTLKYAQTRRGSTRWANGVPESPVPQQLDNSVSTRLAGSYSFSRTIEAGTNAGYSYTKGLTGTATKTTDLDIWVLFRF